MPWTPCSGGGTSNMTMSGAWSASTVGRSPSWTAVAQRSIRSRICCSPVMPVSSSRTGFSRLEPAPAHELIATRQDGRVTAPAGLLDAARSGDAGAFEQLVAPHRAELRAYCYRMLGSLRDAEDAVQEAMIRAWRGLAGFEGRSSLRSW